VAGEQERRRVAKKRRKEGYRRTASAETLTLGPHLTFTYAARDASSIAVHVLVVSLANKKSLSWIDIRVVFLLTRETILEETKTKLVADLNAQALGVS
jgi:hypothetical protein